MDMAKPKIRFNGYTEDWEQRKLGELVGIYDGVHQTPDYQDSGIMFLSVENIVTLKSEKYIAEEAFERDYKVYPEKGDILMTRIGDVGTTNVVETAEKVAFYVSLALLKPNGIDSYFLSNAMKTNAFQKGLRERTLVTAIPQKINKDEIGKIDIFITNNDEEQKKIGAYFSNLDHLITLHQRKCEQTKTLKKYMLQKMFPQDGEKVPQIRFEGFTEDWEQRKVSEMFKVTRGYVLPATDTSQEMTDEMPYPVYSSQTKDNGLMGFYSDYLYEDAITWTTDGANAGTVNFRAGKFYCTNVCGVLLSDKIETSKVIAEALNNVAKRYVSYVGNPKLMNNVMADIQIAVPTSKRERDQISSYLSYLDHLITLHQRKCDELKEVKKFMLQNIFV